MIVDILTESVFHAATLMPSFALNALTMKGQQPRMYQLTGGKAIAILPTEETTLSQPHRINLIVCFPICPE